MAVRDGSGDVKQTTRGFRGPLMVQSLTSAKSKFLSLTDSKVTTGTIFPRIRSMTAVASMLKLPCEIMVGTSLRLDLRSGSYSSRASIPY